MLTPADRERILAEERFRGEVRRQIEQDTPTPKGRNIWALLNSAVAIWFLSTCVVGLLSWGYSSWRSTEQRRTRMRQLDAEVSSRLQYLDAVWGAQTSTDSARTRFRAIAAIDNPQLAEYPIAVFPDLAARSLRSLIWELSDNAGAREGAELRRAWRASQVFPRLFLRGVGLMSQQRFPGPGAVDFSIPPSGAMDSGRVRRMSAGGVPLGVLMTTWSDAVKDILLEAQDLACLSALDLSRWGNPLQSLRSAKGAKCPFLDEKT